MMGRSSAYLRLARISNLPTVWSNVLAASALTGYLQPSAIVAAMAAASALYVGGMFLNDAFDQDFDASHRPDRPLPSRAVGPAEVWSIGYSLLAGGVILLALMRIEAGFIGLALACAIVLYNAWHKGNPFAPIVMGTCRALVYLMAAAVAGAAWGRELLFPAAALLAYTAGLTFIAREESLDRLRSWWPAALLAMPAAVAIANADATYSVYVGVAALALAIGVALRHLRRRAPGDVGRAVSLLIAAIALVDATFALSAGHPAIAALCATLFAATVVSQRIIPGT